MIYPYIPALILLVLLQAADVWTTYIIVEKRGGRELNPFLARLFKEFGLVPTLLIVKVLFLVIVLELGNFAFTVAFCVFYLGVVIHNYFNLRKG